MIKNTEDVLLSATQWKGIVVKSLLYLPDLAPGDFWLSKVKMVLKGYCFKLLQDGGSHDSATEDTKEDSRTAPESGLDDGVSVFETRCMKQGYVFHYNF